MSAHVRKEDAPAKEAANYGIAHRFLKIVSAQFGAIFWRIEQRCARIETAYELEKWNRGKK